MKITPHFLYEISSQLLIYNQICDIFNIPDEQRNEIDTGRKLVEEIKQLQISALINKNVLPKQE